MRPYSLAQFSPPGNDRGSYLIGVKREPSSRGGSAALHERVKEGDLIAISTPRNHFAIEPQARRHLLLAGGIGMTPLLAMAQQLTYNGADFELCVFARSRAHLAFAHALAHASLAPHLRLHFDDPAAPEKLDLNRLLAPYRAGTHLYLCGPAGFMQAAQKAAVHWPEEAVHKEYFAPPRTDIDRAFNQAFELKLTRRQQSVHVDADQSAVQALRNKGILVPTSCEQGVCGSCVVDYSEGEPEHRDFCLSATERRKKIALCCSRAKSPILVLDL